MHTRQATSNATQEEDVEQEEDHSTVSPALKALLWLCTDAGSINARIHENTCQKSRKCS